MGRHPKTAVRLLQISADFETALFEACAYLPPAKGGTSGSSVYIFFNRLNLSNNYYLRIISQRVGRLIRIQGFEGSRVRVKITEKQIHIEKFLTLGTIFLYRHTLKTLKSKGRENVSIYAICIKPFAFT